MLHNIFSDGLHILIKLGTYKVFMESFHGIAFGATRVNVKVGIPKTRKTVETEYFQLRLTHCNQIG